MSEVEPAARTPRGCYVLGCILSAGGVVFFFLLMMAGIGIGLLELGWTLLIGWTAFISRVIPKISWDWSAILTGVVFAGVVGFLAHRFLTWMTRGIAVARGGSFQWQLKWTVCSLVLFALCFLIGMSVAGAAHQIGWVLGSKEPLYENRFARYRLREVSEVEFAVRQALLDANTLPELRKNLPTLLKGGEESRRASPLDFVQLLVSMTPSNTVDGVLILATGNTIERGSARYVTANDSAVTFPKDVHAFIQSNATNVIAF